MGRVRENREAWRVQEPKQIYILRRTVEKEMLQNIWTLCRKKFKQNRILWSAVFIGYLIN